MGSLSGNPYLINNPNGGMKSDQQLNMGMNGMNMMGGMNGMNMQIPGGAIFPGIGMAAAIPADPRRFVYSGDEITYKVRFDQLQ
jgi:hypothetical protein